MIVVLEEARFHVVVTNGTTPRQESVGCTSKSTRTVILLLTWRLRSGEVMGASRVRHKGKASG